MPPPPAPPAVANADANADVQRLCAELAQARADAAALREQLALAQGLVRMGAWTAELEPLRCHWEPAALRLWGLPEQADPHLALADLLPRVAELDRDTVARAWAQGLQRPGAHDVHFRVRDDTGLEWRVHAHWHHHAGPDGAPGRLVGLLLDDSGTLRQGPPAGELESQLALAVDAADVLIWRHDLARGRILWSDQGWRALGMVPRPEGLTLEEVRALIHPDDLPRVLASAQEALASDRAVELEARYRHSNGQWRTQLLRRLVLRDAQGTPVAFLGVALDITERRAEQRRAQAFAARLDTVSRAAGIGHWVKDREHNRIEWSPQCRTIHGLAPGEPVPDTGRWLHEFVHPDDRDLVRRGMQALEQRPTGEALELGFRIVRRGGEVRRLASHTLMEHEDGGPVVFGVLIDITDRTRSEQALQAAQQRIALALRGAGIGTWELDLETRATVWDEQMWRLRGLEPRATSPGEDELWQWVHPEDRERSRAHHQRAEDDHRAVDNEFRVVTPDGRERWLASRSAEVHDAAGRRRRIGVNWDVTAARQADAARRESELARRESQAKSQFLARVSHELRTPLNAVLGFAQLMRADEPGDTPESRARCDRIDHVHAAGRHLLDLIDGVLTLSGVEGGELPLETQPVALAPLLAQVLPMLSPARHERGVRVQTDVPEALHVRGDATRLRQVLLNLAGNAIKYNRPEGTVHIAAEAVGERVRLRIADTGRGMDAQQLRHLFEPFNRLGAERSGIPGTGIGLAIVKALVERMQGTVHVHSSPGAGSVFTVELPRAEAEPAAGGPEPASPSAAAGLAAPPARAVPLRRVLYIEDNPVNALIIDELVARRGDLELHIAADGVSGLAQARALQPELLLLDMQLPDIDGLDVLRRLRADPATSAIPVVALSANAMPDDIDRALAAGCSGYWTKPLDFRAFMASLEALFGKPPG